MAESQSHAPEPFFRRQSDLLIPTPQTRGPWNPNSMHGRVLSGLLAHTVQQHYGHPDFHFARLTIDLFRLPMMAPVSIDVRPTREGNRIKVLEGVIYSHATTPDGRGPVLPGIGGQGSDGGSGGASAPVEVARGTIVMLKKAGQPEGTVWTPPTWDVPSPDEIPAPEFPPLRRAERGPGEPALSLPKGEVGPSSVIPSRVGRADGGEEGEEPRRPSPAANASGPPSPPTERGLGGEVFVPMWETRPITGRGPGSDVAATLRSPGAGRGGFGGVEQKRAWIRESRLLVEGEPLTPFVRAALAADYTNPFANSGDRGLNFVNADITLYLHRLPQTDWIGFEVASHQSEEGIAVGECTLYDERGPIGHSLVCAVANSRTR